MIEEDRIIIENYNLTRVREFVNENVSGDREQITCNVTCGGSFVFVNCDIKTNK